jgi:hypothetical protein
MSEHVTVSPPRAGVLACGTGTSTPHHGGSILPRNFDRNVSNDQDFIIQVFTAAMTLLFSLRLLTVINPSNLKDVRFEVTTKMPISITVLWHVMLSTGEPAYQALPRHTTQTVTSETGFVKERKLRRSENLYACCVVRAVTCSILLGLSPAQSCSVCRLLSLARSVTCSVLLGLSPAQSCSVCHLLSLARSVACSISLSLAPAQSRSV